MNSQDFWKVYQTTDVRNIKEKCIVMDCPVGSDCGILKFGLFQDENQNWCFEKSRERSNFGDRRVFQTEDEAVLHLCNQIEYYTGVKITF